MLYGGAQVAATKAITTNSHVLGVSRAFVVGLCGRTDEECLPMLRDYRIPRRYWLGGREVIRVREMRSCQVSCCSSATAQMNPTSSEPVETT